MRHQRRGRRHQLRSTAARSSTRCAPSRASSTDENRSCRRVDADRREIGQAMRVSANDGALPPLHNAWLGALTGIHDPPSEPKATCGDCVMCGGVERSGTYVTFSPDVKCCTYV